MTVTETYGRAHAAFLDAARRHALVAYDVRMLVALLERGGTGTTEDLERELHGEGAGVRRSSLTLRARGLVRADHGDGTVGTKPGIRARLVLTERGREVAARAREKATEDVDPSVVEALVAAGDLLAAWARAARGHYGIEETADPGQPPTEWDDVQDGLALAALRWQHTRDAGAVAA